MFCKITDDSTQREKKIIDFWKQEDIFKKSIDNRINKQDFIFYEGPPTANGKPHMGHISTRAVKDIILRYKRMKNFRVYVKAGWDTHGLPVELEVEKELNLDGKNQIESYGIENFIKKCKESVWKYKTEWEQMTERIGFWADMPGAYITYENKYIESVWWALKKIWDKKLIYQGYKVVPYCPRCGTALSSHEVAQGYKSVKEKSVTIKFKLENKSNEFFLAWTTTPWTLPSNVALVVNANENYVRVKYENEIFILAENLLEKVFDERKIYENKTEKLNYEVIDKILGKDLVGKKYLSLFDYDLISDKDKKNKNYYCVISDDYVTLSDGTGIVHCSPAFGEDDARVGSNNNLVFLQPVDERGRFKENITDLKNIFVKDADKIIIEKLKKENKLFCVINYEHNYPFCWRCDTPLLYYARNSWFIKTTEVKNKILENNNKINWIPEHIKNGRFGNFLENIIDWGLSRERYWGTPLNIWQCECGYEHAIGSLEELKNMSDEFYDALELHKPYIDKIYLNCPKCGKKMKRVPEVIDCWFDSGAMPFAQWHYPFENKELFEKSFPADFISEAVDQTRGWFYTLLTISTLLFGRESYKNVIVLGHVQDKFGQKMSKHKGNVISPWEVLDNYGADLVRWYFYTNSAPYLPSKFDIDALKEIKILNTILNVYNFFALYANIDKFNINNFDINNFKLNNIIDKWIIAKLNLLISDVDNFLDKYKITEAARAINIFVEELSNWYIRRSRERFWANGMPQDKIDAYLTLYKILLELTKILAPFMPFVSEEIYLKLTQNKLKESVHLEDFPIENKNLIDKDLINKMNYVLKIVELGRAARNSVNIKNRQPLNKIYVLIKNQDEKLNVEYSKIILEELNIKSIEFISEEHEKEFVNYIFKPNLKSLGKKYGKFIPEIKKFLSDENNYDSIKKIFDENIVLNFDNQEIILSKEDVLIETKNKSGFVFNLKIILDINLTDELLEEGLIRELISKIQTMRKEANFEVMDKIIIYYSENQKIKNIFDNKFETFMKETLCDKIICSDNLDGFIKDWNINGEKIKLAVKKI